MICCVTGHRPSGFPFPRLNTHPLYMDYYVRLANEIEKFIWMGYDTFISGMADGADIDFANMVIMHKKTYKDILLEAVLPYPIRTTRLTSSYHISRNSILMSCDKTHIISYQIIIFGDVWINETVLWLTERIWYMQFGAASIRAVCGIRSNTHGQKESLFDT